MKSAGIAFPHTRGSCPRLCCTMSKRSRMVLPLFLGIIALSVGCRQKQNAIPSGGDGWAPDRVLARLDHPRGIAVVLSDTLSSQTLQLAQHSELVIYLQVADPHRVARNRQLADQSSLLNSRVYIEAGASSRIHLADNLADAVILEQGSPSEWDKEIHRVLRPGGKAFTGKKEWTKPFPKGIDDWSHPLHGPDNNPQSKDKVAVAPYLTQFLAEPHYAPAAQVAVASAGRLFKGFGHIAFHEREEAYLNKLVAFNGYNGTLLWQRDLVPGIMLHRNTIIATPDLLYVGDDRSCKLYDSRTGEWKGEIAPDAVKAGGTFWKWMALQDGTLYALIGEQEMKDPVMRWDREKHGWPWDAISPGFNQQDHPWGFGRDFFAIDAKTKKISWHYHEEEPIDSRALCMHSDRVFLFRFGAYLTCLDARSGKKLWRKTPENAKELFTAIGAYLHRQGWETNWRSRNYVMCSDEALYFAGPQIDKLLAVSARDGRVLWENPFNNFQLVLRDDGLYGIGGIWRQNVSKKFDPLTGDILADLPIARRACTRPTGAADAVFFRADDGTVRLDVQTGRPQWISPMRPPCFDGVTIANGHLYWWPFVCDCQLSIYGLTALGPAGDFNFYPTAADSERLETAVTDPKSISSLLHDPADWPTFRKNNIGNVTTTATIADSGRALWRFAESPAEMPGTAILGHPWRAELTAPVTVDGLIYYAGSDGSVNALDEITGERLWKAHTGGAVRFPPTVHRGHVLVGSGDGWIYSFAARTGQMAWRFRIAPSERKIPVYGNLLSTWPGASGVLVEDGIAYVAAGILNYDGVYIYALDAETGRVIWQNNSSGHLLREARTGASVQGHLLIHDHKLYLAGGTSLSPAVYDLSTGACLNDPEPLKTCDTTHPRGWELYLIGNRVVAAGKPFYSRSDQMVFDPTVTDKLLHTHCGGRDVLWVNQSRLLCLPRIDEQTLNDCVAGTRYLGFFAPLWKKISGPLKPIWEHPCPNSVAMAVAGNAVAVANADELTVLDLRNGKTLWRQMLEYAPRPWGLAVSRAGRIILTLEDGSVRCYGGASTAATPFILSNNTYFVDSTRIVLGCHTSDAEIYYTLDGSEPTRRSARYHTPFRIKDSAILRMRAYTRTGVAGYVVSEALKKVVYEPSATTSSLAPGVRFAYYEGSFNKVADMERIQPVETGLMMACRLQPRDGVEAFGYVYDGYLLAPADGVYTFYLLSNDGSKLYLNGKELIDNDGPHGAFEKSATLALKKGEYPIQVKYFQAGAGKALRVGWSGPKWTKQELTAETLFHQK